MPAEAAPRVITREEKNAIRKHEKQKKAEAKDKKKYLAEMKKRAAALKKELATITPIPMPNTKVADDQIEGLEQAAKEGDAAAMVQLGHYYMEQEKPGNAHKKKAGEYFHRAAETGNADAIAWSALYDFITMPNKNNLDQQKAARQKCCTEAKKAADDGSCIGAYLAGLMTEDEEEKKPLYEKSARAGFVPAMRALGYIIRQEAANDHLIRTGTPPDDACLWLELAFKNGDLQAAITRSSSGRMIRTNTDPDSNTDPAEVEKWLRAALPLALQRERHWFGNIFDATYPSPFVGSWGGERMYSLLIIYSNLLRTREFAQKNSAEIARECCNTIKKMASAGEVDAMAAAVLLPRKWSFWMGLNSTDPGILKEKEWLPKLKAKADAGDIFAAAMLKECNQMK